jgi:periplasmic divalent cation tolerance protein
MPGMSRAGGLCLRAQEAMMTKALIVYVTAASRKEADKIAQALLTEKLAACVTIVPGVSSRYWWKGKMETAREVLLIIKTMPSRYKALEKRVRAQHSYDVPEILAMPVVTGNPAYLRWIKTSLR